MTPEQEATSKYLIEYRNASGELLLPQYGGCWHKEENTKPYHDFKLTPFCRCGKRGESYCPEGFAGGEKFPNPDLFTWPGFGELKEAMKKRGDWNKFIDWLFTQSLKHIEEYYGWWINEETFPSNVESYLKGLERC